MIDLNNIRVGSKPRTPNARSMTDLVPFGIVGHRILRRVAQPLEDRCFSSIGSANDKDTKLAASRSNEFRLTTRKGEERAARSGLIC